MKRDVKCKPNIDRIMSVPKSKQAEKHCKMLAIQTKDKGAN